MRRLLLLTALLFGLLSAPHSFAKEPAAGNWKLVVPGQGPLWLVALSHHDGQWKGQVLDQGAELPNTTLAALRVAGESLRFTLKLGSHDFLVEAMIARETSDKMLGSLDTGRQITPLELLATQATRLRDTYESGKELLARKDPGPEAFDMIGPLLRQASSKKATVQEVQAWTARAFDLAHAYGPRLQCEVGARIAEALATQGPMLAAVAIDYGRRAEQLVDPGADSSARLRVLEPLAMALKSAGNRSDANTLQAKIDQLELQADREYLKRMPTVATTPFAGPRKSQAIILVELFTGSQCPPCVAADLAFDALTQTYQPADALFLEYHLHIPGPDPLTNADAVARQEYYGDAIAGTPTILFNGKPEAPGGGPAEGAKSKYNEYCDVINAVLDKSINAPRLTLSGNRNGDKIELSADASGVPPSNDPLRLRFVLIEEQVRYPGGNNVRLHHHVVRAFPGGVQGKPVQGTSARQSITFDLGELRQTLGRYLDEYGSEHPFPSSRRPLALEHLAAIAFLQNDATKEILQSAYAKLEGTERRP
jgi:hypothetical protein